MILICIFLVTKDVEQLSMGLSANLVTSLVKWFFKSFRHFLKIALFTFLPLTLSSVYILDTITLLECHLQIFSTSLQLVFSFSRVFFFFYRAKMLNFVEVQFVNIFFMDCTFA